MAEKFRKKGAPTVPDPDIEVASHSSYGRGYRAQVKGLPGGAVRIPDPDSEVESIDDHKSAVMIGRPSQLTRNKQQLLNQNFFKALVEAAKPTFSYQEVPQGASSAFTAAEIRERYAE